MWTEFKPNVDAGVKLKDAIPTDKIEALAKTNLPLLREMNKAVKMYEVEAAK